MLILIAVWRSLCNPQLRALGFSQEEWLEDPVRWYPTIHPDDNSAGHEAPEMFLLLAIPCDRRTVWWRAMAGDLVHCEPDDSQARREPWFIHESDSTSRPQANRRALQKSAM